ncbi:hypothetical protein AURDEDRAFT_166006 [Auricularia subglabra TFB-10046 SS5]|nr:hypothetical protein AURDEDRAFT_166006 [Auricularia subglabra TFB-10046 SS5]
MLRNPSLPPYQNLRSSPPRGEPVSPIDVDNTVEHQGSQAGRPPTEAISQALPRQSVTYAGASPAVFAEIRLLFPNDLLDIQYCQIQTYPRNRRAALRAQLGIPPEPPAEASAPDYGSAYAGWRIDARIVRVCRTWSLEVDSPSEPLYVDFQGDWHLVSPFDVCIAFGVSTGTWSNFRTRFRKVRLAYDNLQSFCRDKASDDPVAVVAHRTMTKLSWFIKDVNDVDPRLDHISLKDEDGIWRWSMSAYRKEVLPWVHGVPASSVSLASHGFEPAAG